jgi:hypothetical protein
LLQVIAIFCEFWNFGSDALGPLHAAGASDPEFGASSATATSGDGTYCPFSLAAWPRTASCAPKRWVI